MTMLSEFEPGKKLEVFLVEEDRGTHEPLYMTILRMLHDAGVAGASVFKGNEGFGERRAIHTDRLETMSVSLPITIEAIDSPEMIDVVAPRAADLLKSGVVVVNRTSILRRGSGLNADSPIQEGDAMLTPGPARKLIIYINEQDRWGSEALYEAILRFLRENRCAGATVSRAVAGFGAGGEFHRAKLLQFMENLPMRIEVIESEGKIDSLLPRICEMVKGGLIEAQDTELIKHAGGRAE